MSDMTAYDKFRMKITDEVLVRCTYFIDSPRRTSAHYPQDLVRVTLYYRPDGYRRSMRFIVDMTSQEAQNVARDLTVVAQSNRTYNIQGSQFYGS